MSNRNDIFREKVLTSACLLGYRPEVFFGSTRFLVICVTFGALGWRFAPNGAPLKDSGYEIQLHGGSGTLAWRGRILRLLFASGYCRGD
jgi:hypothetical protein